MVDTQRYWDGRAWTDAIAPGGTPSRGAGVDPTFAWCIAIIPLAWVVLAYLAPRLAVSPATYFGGALLGIGLAFADSRRLERAGHKVEAGWSLLAGIVYLISRTRRVHSTPAIPIVWVASAAFSFLALSTFAQVLTVDQTTVQDTLSAWTVRQGETGVNVSCPSTIVGRAGSTFTCTLTTSDIARAYFTVTIHGDKSITWKVVPS